MKTLLYPILLLCCIFSVSCSSDSDNTPSDNLEIVFLGETAEQPRVVEIEIYSTSYLDKPIYKATLTRNLPHLMNLNADNYILRPRYIGSGISINEVAFQIQEHKKTKVVYDKDNIASVSK